MSHGLSKADTLKVPTKSYSDPPKPFMKRDSTVFGAKTGVGGSIFYNSQAFKHLRQPYNLKEEKIQAWAEVRGIKASIYTPNW